MEVASGKHLEEAADTTRLESSMSFRQIWTSMSLQEKICHAQHEICHSKRETVFVWLEAVANADKPYSLLQVIGRGHVIAKSGSVAYMMRCNLVEVLLVSATTAQMRFQSHGGTAASSLTASETSSRPSEMISRRRGGPSPGSGNAHTLPGVCTAEGSTCGSGQH